MNIAARLTADIRARSSYLPPCPLCSWIGVAEFPDQINGPRHRTVILRANRQRETDVTTHKISGCCELSRTDETFESEPEAVQWWLARRQARHPDIATDNRRLNVLRKLQAANLEPIV